MGVVEDRIPVPGFSPFSQPTKSYEYAPQREEYSDGAAHLRACYHHSVEWRAKYECLADPERIPDGYKGPFKCANCDCPQHGELSTIDGVMKSLYRILKAEELTEEYGKKLFGPLWFVGRGPG